MEALYLKDSYMKECDATVVDVRDGKYVVLDQTVFYPSSGGQPHDTGRLVRSDGSEFSVLFVKKTEGRISHEVSPVGLNVGDKVHCILDWERRYKLMRSHTAAHLLASVFHSDLGALITGNQLDLDKTRFDFDLENFDRGRMEACIAKTNELAKKGMNVRSYELPRDEAMKIPGVVKLAGALPPSIAVLRIVEIEGADVQADGGTHVRNTSEIGALEIVKLENKGKTNRRLYFRITP
jgi:misacylated tRNA(Ala) deacylase